MMLKTQLEAKDVAMGNWMTTFALVLGEGVDLEAVREALDDLCADISAPFSWLQYGRLKGSDPGDPRTFQFVVATDEIKREMLFFREVEVGEEDDEDEMARCWDPHSPEFERTCHCLVSEFLEKNKMRAAGWQSGVEKTEEDIMKDWEAECARPLFLAQLTSFVIPGKVDAEGKKVAFRTVISMGVSHRLMDMGSTNEFMQCWSQRTMERAKARALKELPPPLVLTKSYVLNRERICNKESQEKFKTEEEVDKFAKETLELDASPLDREATKEFYQGLEKVNLRNLCDAEGRVVACIIPAECLKRVKHEVCRRLKEKGQHWVSTHEIITGAMLQAFADVNGDPCVALAHIVNLRDKCPRFTLSKDEYYIGNGLSRVKGSIEVKPNDMEANWIDSVSLQLHSNLRKFFVAEKIDEEWLLCQSCLSLGRANDYMAYRASGDLYDFTQAPRLKLKGLTFSSWTMVDLSKCTFGGSKVEWFGEYSFNGIHSFTGYCLITPVDTEGSLRIQFSARGYEAAILKRLGKVFGDIEAFISPPRTEYFSQTSVHQKRGRDDTIEVGMNKVRRLV